ncbi:hypothetical protein [Bacillus sinesaloumensis]|uniref:hypothetical protein n=1 Tax=Litchfieldia sinesaloumensis TaxID=1926280 RepID=UPI0009884307|nr:hypothetical protein [Bacillus sinesaloumensis]
MRIILLILYSTIFLLCTAYQDLPLVNTFGEIARTPIFFLTPIFIIVELILIFRRKFKITKLQKYLLNYILFTSTIGLIYVLILFLKGEYSFLNENLFLKYIKGELYLLLIFLYIRHCYLLFVNMSKKNILLSILVVLTILNLIILIEYFTIPNALLSFHSENAPYYRIRLLTAESSWTGTIYIVYCFIALYLTKEVRLFKSGIITYIILTITLYTVLTLSKGFLMTLLISLLLFVIQNIRIKKISYKQILVTILGIGLLFAILAFVKDSIVDLFLNDIESYTSVATRSGLLLAEINILLLNPLGTGKGAYIFFLANEIPNILKPLRNIFIMFFNATPNVSELIRLSTDTKGLGMKSGILQWGIEGGLFAFWYFIQTFIYLFKGVKQTSILKYSLLFILIAITTYISIDIKYEIWLLFAFVEFTIHSEYKAQNN